MSRMTQIRSGVVFATAVLGGAAGGCASDPIGEPAPVSTAVQGLIGDALPGITAADFDAARTAFNTVEGLADGLGPIFNERACGNCHTQGAAGGAGTQIERRFGAFVNGVFTNLASEGGSLRQLFTVGKFTGASGQSCNVPQEQEPADATVHDVGRLTTPLFGLGLVDSLPDSVFDSIAANEPSATRGLARRVTVLLPNSSDPTQAVGSTRVGRFGWKAGIATLVQFAADAYVNEMGITTQHCIAGQSVLSFATESAPNGIPEPVGCDDLGPGGPGLPPGTDEGPGSCAGGLTEIQDDVQLFTNFMTFLAPPPRDLSADAGTLIQGAIVFAAAGCGNCHFAGTYTTPAAPANGVPGSLEFRPFSDFLVHDMGSLGDLIGNDGDTVAQTRLMRTAPLWGLRFRTRLLHDGRTQQIAAAINAHDGQGAASAAAFAALSQDNQKALITFLLSL